MFAIYLRTSQALIIFPDENIFLAYNFFQKTSFACNYEIHEVLSHFMQWQDSEYIIKQLAEYDPDDLRVCLSLLVENGALVEKNSHHAQQEKERLSSWLIGLPTCMFHYHGQDNVFLTVEESEELQLERLEHSSPPTGYLTNENFDHIIDLPTKPETSLYQTMIKRRTIREVKQIKLPLSVLSDCLFSGLGITGTVNNCTGSLPLSMTPSGGARNPYEAYIYVRRIEGLKEGVYHYSALEHSLGYSGRKTNKALSFFLADQEWANDMTCIIFLVAYFDRTMWKYRNSNAYRVALIEAGHIGQNIMLVATDHGCSACPTAALSHELISETLDLQKETVFPVYALTLGEPTNT